MLLVHVHQSLVVVLLLVVELGVVLLPDLLVAQLVDGSLLLVLNLLRAHVVTHEHFVRQIELMLSAIQLLVEQVTLQLMILYQLASTEFANLQLIKVLVGLLLLEHLLLLLSLYRIHPHPILLARVVLLQAILEHSVLTLLDYLRPLHLVLLSLGDRLAHLLLLGHVSLELGGKKISIKTTSLSNCKLEQYLLVQLVMVFGL